MADLGVVSFDKYRGIHLLFSKVVWPPNPKPKRVRINSVPNYGRLKTREEAQQVLTLIRQRAMGRPLFEILTEYIPTPPAEAMVPARWVSDFLPLKRAEHERGEISKDRLRELEALPRRGYLEPFANVPVGRIDDPMVQQWWDWLRTAKPDLSMVSLRHVVTDFGTFCRHMKRIGALTVVPSFPRVKVMKQAKSTPDRESIERILEHIPEAERGLWIARAYAGLRPAESRRVDVRDYRNGVLHIRPEICKTATERHLPLDEVAPELVVWIEKHRKGATPWEPLFPAPRARDKRWRPTPERRVWIAALEAAQLEHVAPNLGGRHHFATHELAVLQTDPLAGRDFLGHRSLETTMQYVHADPRRLARRMRPVSRTVDSVRKLP